jgi:hypothetical protein
MANRPVAEELLSLEKRYWTAMKQKDPNAAMRLTHDPCLVAGASGVSEVDHKALALMMKDAPWTLDKFELSDVKVKQIGDEVAIVAYKVKESLTVDGKPVEIEAADASTWIWSKDRWVCAMHAEAIQGDPYGRDRSTRH